MRLLTQLILVITLTLPSLVWATNVQYILDVQIEPQNQKLMGVARLKANQPQKLTLSVPHLSKLRINGKPVSALDDRMVVTIQSHQELVISYEARLNDQKAHFVDQDNVFLMANWYPQPNVLAAYQLSVTLPNGFLATSEAQTVEVQNTSQTATFTFQFNQGLDSLTLAASKNYRLKTDNYNNIALEAYFFKDDAHLADTYLEYAKKYLAMYEQMLTPYPFKRFAIVENIRPTGYSMPTYTLLGRAVVRLPFIVKTSLGHEILHQWFGNSVYIDYDKGNWAEGLTNYLADQHYAALSGNGSAYRKQIMVDYNAYVHDNNAMPVNAFEVRHNKAQSAIGYGKTAMIFHQLRKRVGDKTFFAALREFLTANSFRAASWRDIQHAFEKVSGQNLTAYFAQWLERKDIPHMTAEKAELVVAQGKLTLSFSLVQHTKPYHLQLPITIHSATGKTQHRVKVNNAEQQQITLILEEPPTKVVIDEDYDIMRQLRRVEIPPTLGRIKGNEKIIVVMSPKQRQLYQPLLKALGIAHLTVVAPQQITFTQVKNNSLIIAGFDTPMIDMLFGKQSVPADGVRVAIRNNPYNNKEVIALLHAKNVHEVKAVARRVSHYGKYSVLAFTAGKNTHKAISQSNTGMTLLTRSATHALQPGKVATLSDILPKIKDSRVIYVGEQHDNFAHHFNQLLIIKQLHQAGHKIAVGMEMFQVPYQQALDDYIGGRIDELTFLQQSRYFNNWRFDYNLYKPIIDYVKAAGIPLIALNIDKHITNKVARQGIHSLTAAEKQHLPVEMDFSNDTYRHDLHQVFLRHQKHFGHSHFEYFLQSQSLWDETMAQTAAQFLAQHPDTQLIILAGKKHIMHRYGIPNRLYRRNGEPFTVIVQDEQIDESLGDYILITEKLNGKASPKLGVWVVEKDNQVVINRLNYHTSAKKAGLQAKDIITELAGREETAKKSLKTSLLLRKKITTNPGVWQSGVQTLVWQDSKFVVVALATRRHWMNRLLQTYLTTRNKRFLKGHKLKFH